MKNILVLSAGRRVELIEIFQRELRSRNLNWKVIAADMKPELSAACQVADKWIKVPAVSDTSYIDFLLGVCRSEEVSMIIPTIDTELLILAQHRELFDSLGFHVVISNESLIRQCRDKRLTANLFSELGIASPKIFERSNIKYPCFAKPYDGSCSVGAVPLLSSDMLSGELLSNDKMMFMEMIDSSYDEYTIDAYYDRGGVLRCYVPRQRLEVRSGEISKGVTRRHYVYDYLRHCLQRLEGARGCITLQLFSREEPKSFAALEINPRFGGGYPLSYSAGANYPGWLIEEFLLEQEVFFTQDWEENLMMLRYDSKVLIHGAL